MNLKISSDSLDHDEIAETLLDEAGVLDLLPTNEFRVLDYLGRRQLSFDFGEEPDFVRHAPDIPPHLRAALSVNDRVVVTHSELGAKRHPWSVFHEIAHFVLPEHIEKIFLDTDKTLNPWTKGRWSGRRTVSRRSSCSRQPLHREVPRPAPLLPHRA